MNIILEVAITFVFCIIAIYILIGLSAFVYGFVSELIERLKTK